MHMADTLISPAVGGSLWVVSAGLAVFCAHKVRQSVREQPLPLMGVLGAFVFAAQMVDFSIPGTGSSGHLGGGLLLGVLLGPHAAFLVVAAVLAVQAFLFADGGLLAMGCNIFNLGFLPAFVAYPLYRAIAGGRCGSAGAWTAAIVAAVVGLQLGAFGVVVQAAASGIAELPFGAFAAAMLPIHLAIGLVEGLATAAVVALVAQARPGVLPTAQGGVQAGLRPLLAGLAVAAAVLGGVASWFASARPDGLEWAVAKVAGLEELDAGPEPIRGTLEALQERTALLPDYGFKSAGSPEDAPGPWPAVNAGTSVAGLLGGALVLGLAGLPGRARKTRPLRRVPGVG